MAMSDHFSVGARPKDAVDDRGLGYVYIIVSSFDNVWDIRPSC